MPKLEISPVAPLQLIRELAADTPKPEEKWFQRDDFDPTYGATELRAAAKTGWIELVTDPDPALWRFRLTPIGRDNAEPSHAE